MITTRLPLGKVKQNTGQIAGLPSNPRQWTQTDIDRIAKSLQETPELFEARPLIVYEQDGEYIILGGNLRYEGAKKNRMKDVPVHILAHDLNIDKLKEIVIKDNGSFGDWDMDALANEWDDLPLKDWGIDVAWDSVMLEETAPQDRQEVEEDDFDAEKDHIEVRCKRGDIWQLGDHRLMCGDSVDLEDVKRLMGGVKADMVLSDPPYGMFLDTDFSTCLGSLGRKHHTRGNKYDKVIGDNEDFSEELINTFFKNFTCEEMFLFGADYFAELLPKKNEGSWLVWDKRKESQADAIGSEFELVWSKKKHKRRMLRHDWFGFLSSQNSADARNRVHPTQKPISLLVDIIEQWGKNSEHIVDLYGGSGSTLIAAEQTAKKSFLMEIDPHYCDVIIARWEKLTGRQAEKIN